MMRPYYQQGEIAIFHGDCREILPSIDADMAVVDPPYGETSLNWDCRTDGWLSLLRVRTFWCFGSLRFFMRTAGQFDGWRFAQDIVWEKHNGSNFHADRFRRVHECVAQFYRGEWRNLYKSPQLRMDATARSVRRKLRPTHTGHIDAGYYVSEDGGPRLERSVIQVASCHGYAEHPTQKPEPLIERLIAYSCQPDGCVLSPFMDSGTDLVVAKRLGRRAIGIEIDERFCEIAATRLGQQVLALPEKSQ